jgi:hypothetical protein
MALGAKLRLFNFYPLQHQQPWWAIGFMPKSAVSTLFNLNFFKTPLQFNDDHLL